MKKILFSSAAALLAVVGASSFKTAKTNFAEYYVTDPITVGAKVLTTTNLLLVDGSITCGSGTAKICIASFNTVNITAGQQHVTSDQKPAATVAKRASF